MARTESHRNNAAKAGGGSRLVLICLGNPGPRYAGTRHNAGWLFADYLREEHGFGPFERMEEAPAEAARGEVAGMPALLVKPTTSMNDSGRVVRPLEEEFDPERDLFGIAHDDLDLPLGSAKGRRKGGHGGHNGVRSILRAAGHRDFFRVKLGVSSTRKHDYDSVADFLLSEFDAEERRELEETFPEAEKVLRNRVQEFAAERARRGSGRDVRAGYLADCLEEARAALDGLEVAAPYPLFLSRRQARRVGDVVSELAKLLRKARSAAGAEEAVRRQLLSYIPEDLRSLVPEPSGSQRLFCAADFHLADSEPKLIELNCAVGYAHFASRAGEALLPLLGDRLGGLERPGRGPFAGFLWRHGLKPLHDPESGELAFLRGFGNRDMFNVGELEGLAAAVEQESGRVVHLCHERDLELKEGRLRLSGGQSVDLIYVEENLSDWREARPDGPLVEAVRRGVVKTFPDLEMFLYTSKGFPALLCDPSFAEVLAPDDRQQQVLRRNVLWSHRLDEHVEPAAYYMLEQGLPLVVKDALGGGGRGVTILRPGSSSQQTGHILRRRMREGRSVLQGYSPPGRWSDEVDLNYDLRVVFAAHEGDINVGPFYARIFRGEKVNFSDPDSGVAPVFVIE